MAVETYVKLTEDHNSSSLQNVTPGELNQAIDIEKLSAHRCEQCGQTLPASYTPPADEDWTTGIFDCFEDTNTGLTGLFCPCILFGHNVAAFNDEISPKKACIGHAVCIEGGIVLAATTIAFNGMIDPDTVCLLTEGMLFAWWVCAIYTGMGRQLLQRKYHLKDSPCDPCIVHCCLHWCAICQEHREMKNHLSEDTPSEITIVDPPQVQQMNANNTASVVEHNRASSSGEAHGQNNLQLQAI